MLPAAASEVPIHIIAKCYNIEQVHSNNKSQFKENITLNATFAYIKAKSRAFNTQKLAIANELQFN
jgi:hypothetical protein